MYNIFLLSIYLYDRYLHSIFFEIYHDFVMVKINLEWPWIWKKRGGTLEEYLKYFPRFRETSEGGWGNPAMGLFRDGRLEE